MFFWRSSFDEDRPWACETAVWEAAGTFPGLQVCDERVRRSENLFGLLRACPLWAATVPPPGQRGWVAPLAGERESWELASQAEAARGERSPASARAQAAACSSQRSRSGSDMRAPTVSTDSSAPFQVADRHGSSSSGLVGMRLG